MKKISKVLFLILFLSFSIIFFSRNQNYYESSTVIGEDAIKRFEKDLADGKEIIPSNYLPPHKNYNNVASRTGLKISKMIEFVVNKTLRKLINYMSS